MQRAVALLATGWSMGHSNTNLGKPMGLGAAVSMGVGAMVGAGIFALLGEAGQRAGGAVWLAFLVAGAISMLSGYSYARLGVRYPSSGGIVEYLAQAYGGRTLTGTLSIVLYLSVTIVLGLVARAFGSYAKALVVPEGPEVWVNVFGSASVVTLTAVNAVGSQAVGRAEKIIVFAKVIVLAAFVLAGVALMDGGLISDSMRARSPIDVLTSLGLCLLAYHGFGVITNTVEDMPTPEATLPKAIYGSIGLVTLLYVGISLAVFGSLSLTQIVEAKDYAMAEAARPIFGQVGFTVVGVTALLSAASCLNAQLYSMAKTTYLLARDGELPEFEAKKVWRKGTGGLFTTMFLVLLTANLLDLSKIASLGSIVYLIVYSAVHLGHWRTLTPETGASRWVILLAFASNAAVLLLFLVGTAQQHAHLLLLLGALLLGAWLLEVYMQRSRGREIHAATD